MMFISKFQCNPIFVAFEAPRKYDFAKLFVKFGFSHVLIGYSMSSNTILHRLTLF